MRTTIDLPTPLYQQLKIRASVTGSSLKDLVIAFVERGLRQPTEAPIRVRRGEPPIAVPATGRPIPALSNAELYQLELEDDLRRFGRITRR